MSYLKNLRRLLPARKAWRVFTTKLQSKLHKLNQSKAIKKPRKNQLTTTPNSKATLWPSLSFQSRFQRKRRRSAHPVNTLRYKPRHRPQKKISAPVYIDQLFIEPVLALNQPLATTAAGAEKQAPVLKKGKVIDRDQAAAGTSKGDGKSHTADDMWESLVLASPQMNGINERAEEFISRFRAEMQVQEMLDRHL